MLICCISAVVYNLKFVVSLESEVSKPLNSFVTGSISFMWLIVISKKNDWETTNTEPHIRKWWRQQSIQSPAAIIGHMHRADAEAKIYLS